MRHSVDWTRDARRDLAVIWLRAVDRKAVTIAQAETDRRLAADPYGNSVPVSEGLYAIEVSPLRVQFEVSDADQVVTVVSVRESP